MPFLVSWLLPVKDGMPFLRETLASIESQSFHNWEVIAWDNGSTDGSVEELKRWIPARLPGRVIVARPLGLGASLAEMVNLTESEFCARIDADDVNHSSRLEQQLGFMQCHPEVAAVGSQVIRIDESGNEYGQYHQLPLDHDDILYRMLYSWVMWHPTVLFRRQPVLAVGNYRNFEPALIEDYDLWMRLAAKYKLANLDSCLLKYRVRELGATMLAIKQGVLAEAMLKCFVENAAYLFGCSNQEAVALRSHKSRFLFPVVLKIVRHLCRSQGGTTIDRLRNESFHQAVARLLSPKDVFSHLCLACCNATLKGAFYDLRRAVQVGISSHG